MSYDYDQETFNTFNMYMCMLEYFHKYGILSDKMEIICW